MTVRRFSRKAIRRLACIVAVALLSAQSAVAAQACVQPAMAPATAFSGEMTAACADMNSNVCLAQFLQADLVTGGGLVTAAVSVSRLVVALDQSTAIPAAMLMLAHDSGPPIRTRICRLLI